MSFEALQERLAALQDTTAQLRELIDRLANLEFQPGSVPLGGDDEDNVAAELSTEINQVLREEEEDLELLREEVTDLRSGRSGSEAEHAKARLKDGAARLDQELRSCRVTFRKAQLSARTSLQRAQRLERELLLASYSASAASTPLDNRSGASSPGPHPPSSSPPAAHHHHHHNNHHQQLFPSSYRRRRQHKAAGGGGDDDDGVVGASTDVTAALRRTHDQIAAELSRSAFARRTLADSTAALGSLREGYEGLSGLLASSRELAGALLTSAKSDTWYLETSVALLLATLAWLVFRRWLYGPLWWVVWLPARTVWRTGGRVAVWGGGREESAVGTGAGEMRVEVEGDAGAGPGAVPTLRVGGEERKGVPADPDSMVEKVGRIVEGAGEGRAEERHDGGADNSSGHDEPNPKKRMWEEEKETAGEADMARDEL